MFSLHPRTKERVLRLNEDALYRLYHLKTMTYDVETVEKMARNFQRLHSHYSFHYSNPLRGNSPY